MDKVEDLPGVGAATAEKLIAAGYDTFLSIAVTSPGEMVNIAGVTEATARKIINAARSKLEMGFETGEELLRKRESVTKISTGSQSLNAMLGGGIESGAITEVYGAYGSGKTSIAHQLAVNVQLPKEKGGAEGIAVWIDSEGTIRPEYIAKLALAQGLDSKEVLKNFRGVRSFNSDHQMLLTEKVEDLIKEGLQIKLIIVDSLMGHFRSDFSGRGELATRQQKLNKHLHTLLKLANQYNLAIYVTNQVMSKPDTFFGDPTEAIGGHVLHHASTYRVYLRRGKKGTRVAKLVDAPALPESEAIFEVTDEGIKDV
ncbi:DNA repair and recombination protein RadA [Candidatus Woesearchaeota archaeon]|nr:DNA repair and recombination protein RadA [Candidatus Woesearchaeota archaeon]